VEDYLSLAGIEVMLDIPEEMPDKFISAEVRHNIFLVIKEAVNNIVKHSGADKAKLSVLLTEKDKISFSLSDNGKGIDFDKIDKFRNGLQNMRKRIENLNGFFEMKNLEDMGISIHFSLNI
jgi:signal transduction histidine kinase